MSFGVHFDIDKRKRLIDEVSNNELDNNFWVDVVKAKKILVEKQENIVIVNQWEGIKNNLNDSIDFFSLAKELNEPEYLLEAQKLLMIVENSLRALELHKMFSGEHDNKNAIVEINSGAGGTEAMAWTEMLFRMYLRYCDRQGWKTDILNVLSGDDAGIKNCSFIVYGQRSFAFLKAEIGVHRLTRFSPFDSNHKLQTSFASVYVYPDIDESINISIKDSDLEVDFFRASGAGGQKVNKTSSAVRITHVPTKTVVSVQNERSQSKNREIALKILKARLYELEEKKKEALKNKVELTKSNVSFGSQIRSYKLVQQKLVNDVRTGLKTTQVDEILDGNLQEFIEAYLLSNKEV